MPTLAEQLAALIDADRAQPRHYKGAATELRRQHAEIERLRAELAALQEDLRYVAHSGMGSCAPAPAGWQLVPVEPTFDMQKAGSAFPIGDDDLNLINMSFEEVRCVYKAMLSAAPKLGGE